MQVFLAELSQHRFAMKFLSPAPLLAQHRTSEPAVSAPT
jgi:hypothetical protein